MADAGLSVKFQLVNIFNFTILPRHVLVTGIEARDVAWKPKPKYKMKTKLQPPCVPSIKANASNSELVKIVLEGRANSIRMGFALLALRANKAFEESDHSSHLRYACATFDFNAARVSQLESAATLWAAIDAAADDEEERPWNEAQLRELLRLVDIGEDGDVERCDLALQVWRTACETEESTSKGLRPLVIEAIREAGLGGGERVDRSVETSDGEDENDRPRGFRPELRTVDELADFLLQVLENLRLDQEISPTVVQAIADLEFLGQALHSLVEDLAA